MSGDSEAATVSYESPDEIHRLTAPAALVATGVTPCEAVTRSGKACRNRARFRALLPKIGYPNVVCGQHAPPTGPVVYIEWGESHV